MRYLYKCRIICHNDSFTMNCIPLNKEDANEKTFSFRCDSDNFAKHLRLMQASDDIKDPPSIKIKSYKQMVQDAIDKKDDLVYIFNHNLPKESIIKESVSFLESNSSAKDFINNK